jgi:hypothetical protein
MWHVIVLSGSLALAHADMQAVIVRHCGSCHSAASADAKPAALKVFDTDRADWFERLSDARLPKLVGRIDSMDVPPADRAAVSRAVDDELRRRKR